MTEPTEKNPAEINAAAIEEIRGTLSTVSSVVQKNAEALEAIEIPEGVSPTEFEKVKAKVKENFTLLENSLRDAFSQIEKNASSIQTCIDELRVVGGSVGRVTRPASVSEQPPLTLLEL